MTPQDAAKPVVQIFFSLCVVCLAAQTCDADLLLETATSVPYPGGSTLDSGQFLGARFSLDQSHVVTAFGGQIGAYDAVWGAIVSLSGPDAFPDFSPQDIETYDIVHGQINGNSASQDLRVFTNTLLAAGDYALIFGGGGFFDVGSNGFMSNEGNDLGGSLFFSQNNAWANDSSKGKRFVVEGYAVPEPSSLTLLLVGGLTALGVGRWRRRNSRVLRVES